MKDGNTIFFDQSPITVITLCQRFRFNLRKAPVKDRGAFRSFVNELLF